MASNRNRVALVGKIGSGKTTLQQRLTEEEIKYKKTQVVTYSENFIDTPGEFIDLPFFCRNAINVVCDAGLLGVVLAANDDQNKLPPNFAVTFNGPVIGIITKCDLGRERIEKVRRYLELAGVRKNKIYEVSAFTGEGIPELMEAILKYVDFKSKRR